MRRKAFLAPLTQLLALLALRGLGFVAFRANRPALVALRAEPEQLEEQLDIETYDLPELRRSKLKLNRVKSDALDIDAVTARVQEELGGTVFEAPLEEEGDDLRSGAALLQRWALKGTPPEMPREELVALIASSLHRAEPMVLASLMWSCGRLKIDYVAPLLAPLRDRLPLVVKQMNAQNLTTVWCSAAKMQSFAEEVDSMIEPLIDAIIEKADDLKPHQLSAFIWAAGKLELRPYEVKSVTQTLPGLLRRALQEMSMKDLANAAFGLAQLDFRDDAMLLLIAKTTEAMALKSAKRSALQDLPMIVTSLTRLGYKGPEMDRLLDAVAERLQRTRMLQKMPDWSLAALYWSWPQDGSRKGVRDMQVVLYPEVEKRMKKNLFSSRMLERSWMGPSE